MNMLNCTFTLCAIALYADDGVVLPDKASLHLTAIEDAEYKEDN
jgi:type I protein arginine methyltransferase